MGYRKGHLFLKIVGVFYDRHFVLPGGALDQRTSVETITEIGFENEFIPNDMKQALYERSFYPPDYFCPKSYSTDEIHATVNTICIHHIDGSWHTEEETRDIEKYGNSIKVFTIEFLSWDDEAKVHQKCTAAHVIICNAASGLVFRKWLCGCGNR